MLPLKFDPEATVEEIAGIGRHAAFDAVVNDKDDDAIQVVCKLADGTEIPLANPARAFYFGDRILYTQEARRHDLGERQQILNTYTFNRNERRFDELKRACQRGFVIPFVGAGMSKSAGCPEWKEYLLNLCPDAGFDENVMRQRLEDDGDYERVMDDLVKKLGETRFNLDFERDFTPPGDLSGAVLKIPGIFDNCAITTNFDRVLEMAYEKCGKAFVEKTTGRAPTGSINAFYRAIPAGDRHLLKLHGNLTNAAERVLNRGEYDSAYGNDGNIHFDFPVPRILKRLYTSLSFLFLGCSLSYDRTIQTFTKIAQDVGAESLPHHYAILGRPGDKTKRDKLEQRLADAHISPIWFPEGDFEIIGAMLELLRA